MKHNRKENGSMDLIGAVYVLLFVFVMLLVYIGISKSVQLKLQCDTIAKNYLYRMEACGYLKQADYESMVADFRGIGATNVSKNIGTTSKQVAYGDFVVLDVTITVPNPILENLNIDFLGISPQITYDIVLEATAKW